MNNTLLKKKHLSHEEIQRKIKLDKKEFRRITKDMDSINKDMRKLLPRFQNISVFSTEEVTKLSKEIKKYDEFCVSVIELFNNKISPERWE